MVLHEQTGLRIHRNAKNGFVVCRLHYTADPRKRSPEWRQEAARGMSRAKFEQEYEIRYDAQMGELAFPEIKSRRADIICRTGPYINGVFPASLPMWAGFDYGAKNPSAFEVFTQVDGVTWAIWELYEPCRNIIEFSKKLRDCPYWSQIRYIVHDPDISNLKQRDIRTGDVTSVRAQFEQLGITRWVAGNNDESAWLSTMAKHWCGGGEPTFRILESCPMLIDEFENATYVTMSERQLETQNYREALVDRHNHALDATKYFMNSTATRTQYKQIRLPNLVAGYGWSGAASPARPRGRERELGIVI